MAVKFVDEHRDRWPVSAICQTIELAERTYYAAKARPRCARSLRDEGHVAVMRTVWSENFCCYGATRLWAELNRQHHRVARCTVERLMPAAGVVGVQRGKRLRTTIADSQADRPADLVERNFKAHRPNDLWVADITYASTWEGWLYVAFILDVFSRYIAGWQISTSLETQLVLDALEMAIWRRDLTAGPLRHHSDRGGQYTSYAFSDRLADANIAASVGSRGDSYDNAMAESLNGSYKAELYKLHGPWRTRNRLEIKTIEWIEWYNQRRLHTEIGLIPPAEYEADWYQRRHGGVLLRTAT